MKGVASRERGAAAITVALMLIVLIGMAAIAVDIGFGFNERRQDQTSADLGVMAGAIDAIAGIDTMRDQALAYAEKNLTTAYSPAQWQALWEQCVDAELATLNAGTWNFQAVTPPAGWTVTDPANWCISFDPSGFLRVRVPDQATATTFGRVLGVNAISTNADAIARTPTVGSGGIRPFGLGNNVAEGSHECISSGPTGLATDPCTGSASGNFGTLSAPLFGNPALGGYAPNCNAAPADQVLAVNISVGVDHFVTIDDDGLLANEIRDECYNPGVDTLNTDTGFPNQGAAEGLVTGPIQRGLTPLIQQGTNTKRNVVGYQLDDRALWSYLDSSLSAGGPNPAGSVPASCIASSFNNGMSDFDWNGDGTLDRPESWQHMSRCLQDYVAGGYSTVMFDSLMQDAPRFGYLPQFWEATLGPGNKWRHIQRFKAVWLQGLWFKDGPSWVEFHPGENCACSPGGSNWALKQLSGFVLPDAALPDELRGDPPPFGGVNPYTAELFR